MSFPKQRPAGRKSGMERWVRELAEAEGEDPARMYRAVSYMVVAAVLAELGKENELLFVMKGGVVMMMRVGVRARFSKDLDVSFTGEPDELEALLADAPNHPVGPFTVAPLGAPEMIGDTGARRFRMRLWYETENWGTVDLEVGTPTDRSVEPENVEWLEGKPELAQFALDGRTTFPCMSVGYQIAQKLHACSEVFQDRENQRSQDLLDLQLLGELVEVDAWPEVRRACEEVFQERAKQAWPPVVSLRDGWAEEYAKDAVESAFPVTDAETGCQNVNRMIDRIVSA